MSVRAKLQNTTHRVHNLLFFRENKELGPEDVRGARQFIDKYWTELICHHTKDEDSLFALPNPYIVPARAKGQEFDFNEMYYWDSYFIIQGLLDEEHKDLVIGMLENLLFMFERFKIIPNASRAYLAGRSQPPFLTSFIWDVYSAYKLDKKWLKRCLDIAQKEYNTVWMGQSKPNARQVHSGLSRYYDINVLNDLAEAESGWDMTPRFSRKALDYLPIDLNCLLYKYETDFARFYHLTDDLHSAYQWEARAQDRKNTVNKLMWSNLHSIFYDYDYKRKKRGGVKSLAGYYPLWSGLASKEQAAQMVKSLRNFEKRGGLATTDVSALNSYKPGRMPTQWAYPNGWAPLHLLIVKGLQNYGYHEDARRIAVKWLKTNLDWFNRNQEFLEKYNVVQPDKLPAKGVYPLQTGFGWTNAVFERFCREFIDS